METGFADSVRDEHGGEVTLLKFPHPYRAALTVCSDTHATPVPTFEAVHTLINTRNWIGRSSDAWKRLFQDPAIDTRKEWSQGIHGFGLPIADTMWLYSPHIGVFASFDDKTGEPVPHAFDGKDFRNIVDAWLQKGWVGALHTPGPGRISRAATAAGLEWLAKRPHGRLKVWVNHSLENTPTCLEPDRTALIPVIGNLLGCVRMVLSSMGLGFLDGIVAGHSRPRKFPEGQAGLLWLFSSLLVASAGWIALCLLAGPLRRTVTIGTGALIFAFVVTALGRMRLHYGQGDNPGTPYYHADLVREFGFRYFWLINRLPGYETHVPDTLALPEQSCGGRPSCLHLVKVDDGGRILTFGRVYKESVNAWASLDLITPAGLDELCAQQGTAILYTHWTHYPQWVFNAGALDALEHVRRYYADGRVWVAPVSSILHYTFVRAFLRFSVRWSDGTRVIEIERVDDPMGRPFVPTLEDLRGISFEYPGGDPIEVRVGGAVVDQKALDLVHDGERAIVRFR